MISKFEISRITLLLMCSCFIFLFSCSEENEKSEVEVETEIVPTSECETIFSQGINVPSEGERTTISFSTNKDWSVSLAETQSGDNWCIVSPLSGKAGNVTLIVLVTTHTGYDDRNVVLKISADKLTKNIMINQKQKDALTLTSNRFEVDKDGGIINLQVKSNIDYKVVVAENASGWIKPVISEHTRGLSTNFYSFSISPNKAYEKREGEIIIQGEKQTERVKVYQTGEAVLLLTQNEYFASDKGETIAVEIKSNFDFGVKMPNVDWVNAATTRSASSHTFYYVISPNNTYDKRETEIEFYDKNSNIKQSLKVIQAQKDAMIISQKEYLLPSQKQVIEVLVNSNIKYSVIIPDECNWIKQKNSMLTRGLVTSKLYFDIDENTDVASRMGFIHIRNTDNTISETIEISQKRKEQLLNLHVAIAGNLSSLINEIDKYEIKELTLSGNLNGTDIRFLREMMGSDSFGNVTKGKLEVLDISAARIVEGGDAYYNRNVVCYTTADIIGKYMFSSCNLKRIILPENVVRIDESALSWNEFENVIIPDQVTSFGKCAFQGCMELVSITIPGSVKEISERAFEQCNKLSTICINDLYNWCQMKVGFLGEPSLNNDEKERKLYINGVLATEITIPDGIIKIRDDAFYKVSAIKKAIISENVSEIGQAVFWGCENLENITIPKSLHKIGIVAFLDCKRLTSVYIDDMVSWCNIDYYDQESYPFNASGIGHLYLKEQLVTHVIVPNGVTKIGNYSFMNCVDIKSISIPKSVTSIGINAFFLCI